MGTHRLKARPDEQSAKTGPLNPGTGKLKAPTGKLKAPTGKLRGGTGHMKAPTGPLKPKYTTAQLRLPPSKRRRRSNPMLRLFLTGSVVAGLGLAGLLGGAYTFFESLSPGTDAKLSPVALAQSLMPLSGRHNILLMGTDYSYAQGHRLSDGPVRSDAMIVLGVDADAGKLNMVSIPRDTRVLIRDHYDKINAAMAIGGPELATKVASGLLGVPITDWAQVNTHGLERLVDVMGGIRMYAEKDMYYVDETAHLGINIHKGWHLMNGAQAHQFVRFRHDELGDIGRVQRQQQFLRAVAEQLLTPTTIARVPQLLATVQQNITTNLSGTEILRLAMWAPRLSRQNIKMVMLPGEFSAGRYAVSYWLVDPERAESIGHRLLLGGATTAAPRAHYKVTVLNGTPNPGVATAAAKVLREAGWQVWSIGDAPDRTTRHTRIIAQTGHDEQDGALAKSLGVKGDSIAASVGDLTTDFTVIIGEDFLARTASR